VVGEARLYIAQENGRLRGFDSRTGLPIYHEAVSLPRGKFCWNKWTSHPALSKSGQVLALNPQGLSPLWNKPYEVGCEITSAPCRVGKKLFFAARMTVMRWILNEKTQILASGGKGGAPDRLIHREDYSWGAMTTISCYDLIKRQETLEKAHFSLSIAVVDPVKGCL